MFGVLHLAVTEIASSDFPFYIFFTGAGAVLPFFAFAICFWNSVDFIIYPIIPVICGSHDLIQAFQQILIAGSIVCGGGIDTPFVCGVLTNRECPHSKLGDAIGFKAIVEQLPAAAPDSQSGGCGVSAAGITTRSKNALHIHEDIFVVDKFLIALQSRIVQLINLDSVFSNSRAVSRAISVMIQAIRDIIHTVNGDAHDFRRIRAMISGDGLFCGPPQAVKRIILQLLDDAARSKCGHGQPGNLREKNEKSQKHGYHTKQGISDFLMHDRLPFQKGRAASGL